MEAHSPRARGPRSSVGPRAASFGLLRVTVWGDLSGPKLQTERGGCGWGKSESGLRKKEKSFWSWRHPLHLLSRPNFLFAKLAFRSRLSLSTDLDSRSPPPFHPIRPHHHQWKAGMMPYPMVMHDGVCVCANRSKKGGSTPTHAPPSHLAGIAARPSSPPLHRSPRPWHACRRCGNTVGRSRWADSGCSRSHSLQPVESSASCSDRKTARATERANQRDGWRGQWCCSRSRSRQLFQIPC
jgi:hypothetical protein